jgi:hypothetical protein
LGLIFVSHFRPWIIGDSIVLAQREQDLEVRKWLEESGGVEPEHLQWASLVDTKWITLNGIQPKRSDLKWNDVRAVSNEVIFQALMKRDTPTAMIRMAHSVPAP